MTNTLFKNDPKTSDGRTYWRLKCGHVRMLNVDKCAKNKNDIPEAFCLPCNRWKELVVIVDHVGGK